MFNSVLTCYHCLWVCVSTETNCAALGPLEGSTSLIVLKLFPVNTQMIRQLLTSCPVSKRLSEEPWPTNHRQISVFQCHEWNLKTQYKNVKDTSVLMWDWCFRLELISFLTRRTQTAWSGVVFLFVLLIVQQVRPQCRFTLKDWGKKKKG